MFGIGWAELLVIAVVALIVLGPDKLPQAARSFGQVYGRLSRAINEARRNLEAEAALSALENENDGLAADEADKFKGKP